jgi:hypothetical protein
LKVDVDKLPSSAQKHQGVSDFDFIRFFICCLLIVSAMPTFKFFVDNQTVFEFKGMFFFLSSLFLYVSVSVFAFVKRSKSSTT